MSREARVVWHVYWDRVVLPRHVALVRAADETDAAALAVAALPDLGPPTGVRPASEASARQFLHATPRWRRWVEISPKLTYVN